MNQNNITLRYVPAGKTIQAFHDSKAFVRKLCGPYGSGKTTACILEILKKSMEQRPGPDGIRRSRWLIARNTFPELRSTTMKSWNDWVPAQFGKLSMDSPFIHRIQTSELDLEVMFSAFDSPEDTRRLLSLELTGAYLQEFREIPIEILHALTGRVGRFPSKSQGGPSWSGIIGCTNPYDVQSDYYRLFQEECPPSYEFFKQPSGLSPEAENKQNLIEGYYERLAAGKSEDFIKVFVHGEFGFLIEGRPVFNMYRDSVHCAKEPIEAAPGFGLLLGIDFGLTPACVISQKTPDGRWILLDEFVTDNTGMGIKRFGELLSSYLRTNYPDHLVVGSYADPAGNQRAATDEKTCLEVLNEVCSFRTRAAPGDNTLTERLEVMRNALNRMVDGVPGLLVSPKCKTIRKSFANGYHFKLVKTGNGTQTHETPAKNEWSHIMDACQYLLLGGNEYDAVLNRSPNRKRDRQRFAKGHDSGPYGSGGRFD